MADPARADLPEQIGRYRVLRLIGEGGMGRVYAARDPQLDREVAIKLVAPELGGAGAEGLLAEALSMAKLSHPNVVAVHDAGIEGGQAFVAMELVEGDTLRAWQRDRPWREVLRAYLEAGRGLAAAHRAGLTHRDFKPDNVLVSADGRVRVTDFGLARTTALGPGTSGALRVENRGTRADAPASPHSALAPDAGETLREDDLSTPGAGANPSPSSRSALVGTPEYMAPEQLAGARADPRSDQYAFCAALHEALFSTLPRASTAYARSDSPKTVPLDVPPPTPPPEAAPTTSIVPGRRAGAIRKLLDRGLSAAAEERHPSMDALLLSLALAATPPRTWLAGAAAAAILVAVAAPVIVSRARVCEDELSAISDVWSPTTRAAVEQSLAGVARGPARAHVLHALDTRAEAWRAMTKDACEATRVRHQQSAEALDLRMACLHQRLGELGAVSQAIAAGVKDAEAIDLADSLSELKPCADPGTLAALAPPPRNPEALAEIARIRRALSRVRTKQHAGRYSDALADGQALAEAAAKAGYRPVEAEALLELGRARQHLGDDTGAERAFLDALVASEAGRHLRVKAETLIALVGLSPSIRDPQRAREWDRQAAAVIEALGGDRLLTAKRDMAACELDLVEANLDAAEAHAREAVSFLETELGAEHLDTQQAVRALGQALLRRGQPMKAIELLRKQLELRGRIFGPDNPERWTPMTGLVAALYSAGYFEESLAEARAARAEIRGKIPDSANLAFTLDLRIASTLNNLGHQREALELVNQLVGRERGNTSRPRGLLSALGSRASILGLLGRFDEAAADQLEQMALLDKLGGDLAADRGTRAQVQGNLGLELIWSGKIEEGLRHVRAALEQRSAILPPGHPDLRFLYLDLAEGELLGGRPERALEPARTALELTRAAAGPDSPTTSLAQVQLAEALVGIGRPNEAEPFVRRALQNWAAHPGLPDHAARGHFVLAKALAASSPREALEEAERARQGYAALEGFRKAHAAGVEAWIARQRAMPPKMKAPEPR